ncbi:hypothetical protein OG225_38775 [Nocardia sp. NBC_01377]|uniref:hypothetical protein n=1 Tax=Nocardia TaxID=1817 RepID=UPI001C21D552|nr:hypothetical protein [Nocardia noduli]
MSRVQVTSQSVAKLAEDVDSFGERLRGIARNAASAVSPGETAWGDDKFGAKFAVEGEFDPSSTTMVDNTGTIATTFDNLASGLSTAAQDLARTEQTNTQQF